MHPRDLLEGFSRRKFRKIIWERDKRICQLCGVDCSTFLTIRRRGKIVHIWEADHIIPVKAGGATQVANLRILCLNCHKKRSFN